MLNRENGDLISAQKFVPTNWAERIDPETGVPIGDPAKRPGPNHPVKDVCPTLLDGKNWQPMSYNPGTGLVYILSKNICHCHEPDAVQAEHHIDLRRLHLRYGDRMDEVFTYTVHHSRPDKGMPNWSGILSEDDFAKIKAFLHTVQTPSS